MNDGMPFGADVFENGELRFCDGGPVVARARAESVQPPSRAP